MGQLNMQPITVVKAGCLQVRPTCEKAVSTPTASIVIMILTPKVSVHESSLLQASERFHVLQI